MGDLLHLRRKHGLWRRLARQAARSHRSRGCCEPTCCEPEAIRCRNRSLQQPAAAPADRAPQAKERGLWTSTTLRKWCGRVMAESPRPRAARRAAARPQYPVAVRAPDPGSKSRQMGYSDTELAAVPEGANLGLGCGNPQAIAALQPGEVVIDLGSGAGFDCFLAAGQVGPTGRVIGVDMTHEMLKKARENAAKIGAQQCRVSAWRARASAGRRQYCRRHPLQLRDQPRAG